MKNLFARFLKKKKPNLSNFIFPKQWHYIDREFCENFSLLPHGRGFSLYDFASIIFSMEPEINHLAFGDQMGVIEVVTFGNSLSQATIDAMNEAKPIACLVKVEDQ